MVKRKFSGKEDIAKKRKLDATKVPETEQSESDDKTDVSIRKEIRNNDFDIKHFRKELAAKQGQTIALTQFLAACQRPDAETDCLLQYLQSGGNAHEILRQLGGDGVRNLPLATPAFHLFHLIILKVQDTAPHLLPITEEAARYFLNNFASTTEIMISENSGPRHRKIIMKLLTSIVTLNPELGVEVLGLAALSPKSLHHILEKPNYKEKDNVRTTFVHFMTSFLVEGHLPLIKALLEKQGLLPLVLPGLVQDEAEAVLMFLNILKKNVVDNLLISKSLKMKTFNHNVLHQLFKIYFWKGPPETSHEAIKECRPDIIKLLDEIILTLFTSHKLGLYFVDSSLGTSEANKNQNLYKALLSLKRPWEHQGQCAMVLEIMRRCPDLHRAIIHLVEQSFEPQHSPIWERTVDFVIKLLTIMKTEEMVPRLVNLNSAQVTNFVRFTSLPVPLLKVIQTSMGKADRIVALYCIKVLVKMLSTLKRYMQMLDDNIVVDLKNKLEFFLPKHLPTPAVIVSLINQIIKNQATGNGPSEDYSLPNINEADSLILLIDLLLLYSDVHPAHFESLEENLNMKQILDYSSTLSEGHISILQFKIVSLWLTLDHTAVSVSNPLFKELFQIMLQVYTSEDTNTWTDAKETIIKFFKTTSIFETDDDEIHIILYTLRHSKINTAYIVDIIQYILENRKELTEYVRSQMVNFEMTDENNEANLEKLFNDLMLGINTENTCFLESKVPSPFIVGCLQYCRGHKHVSKDLKKFFSLYIANLLHCNYTPELTEMLMGDCKLAVREYVASWRDHPAALDDSTAAQDTILKGISEAVILGNDTVMQDIFPFLEESSGEENALIALNTSYRVNRNIDNSELFVWAKYIVFCTVRLANMGQLQETQQAKITHLFDFVTSLAKYQHKQDICRTIMLSLLKCPHVLKIYSPIDLNKDQPRILATDFLLHVINEDRETIDYLNKRRDVLKSFKQKNYNEVVKTLLKLKKRKTINTEHTVKVIEIVGMSNDDDLKILNLIIELDAAVCVREDKEPSVALEILRSLVMKYSRSIKTDLPQDLLQKIFNLYTTLLGDKNVTPNLTNLETVLVDYFENKPQHVRLISAENFKQFFYANAMRKSTSQLAATLLKFNIQFCNIFKEQVERKEILSQRELTLPLGSAVLHHNKFLASNKQFLGLIFDEYKSNILKVLEKPHKAGQVYITSWAFIRKLLLECIDVADCQKFFNKSHKFEVVEPSHIHWMQAVCLRLCLHPRPNAEFLLNYFLSMLNITTMALKEAKDPSVLNEIVMSMQKIVEICASSPEYGGESSSKLTENSIWQNFCKAVLKDSLRVKGDEEALACGPRLLHLLTNLSRLFYPTDHTDVISLFEMVTSHSEFLKVILSHGHQKIKTVLVEFLYVLISKNKSVMKTPQIPVYLSAYHATTSPCDRILLKILHFYETNDLPMNEYKPYLWGESAANYYAVRKKKASSLWAHPTPNQVLNLFDRDMVEKTVRNYPVAQAMDYNYELPADFDEEPLDDSGKSLLLHLSKDGILDQSPEADNEASARRLCLMAKYAKCGAGWDGDELVSQGAGRAVSVVYDPAFFLPLLSHILAPGSAAASGKLLRGGALALAVSALSSAPPAARAAAAHVLHRFCMLLQTETRQKSDKLLLSEFIALLQRSVPNPAAPAAPAPPAVPRLPAVSALYLARALAAAAAPASALYKPINNFLIAKHRLDLTVLPDFLTLFHDSDVESADRKNWLLETITDGTRTMADVNAIFKTMCLKMIMDYYSSVLSDRRCKERILSVVGAVAAVPRACDILLEGYGLLAWLHGVARRLTPDDRVLFKQLLKLVQNMLYSVSISALAKSLSVVQKQDKSIVDLPELKLNKDLEHDVVVILGDMISFVEYLEVEDAILFVKTYNLLSKRTVKLLSKKQILCLVSQCKVLTKENDHLLLLTKAITSNNADILKCKSLSANEYSILIQELKCIVTNYML